MHNTGPKKEEHSKRRNEKHLHILFWWNRAVFISNRSLGSVTLVKDIYIYIHTYKWRVLDLGDRSGYNRRHFIRMIHLWINLIKCLCVYIYIYICMYNVSQIKSEKVVSKIFDDGYIIDICEWLTLRFYYEHFDGHILYIGQG